MDLFGKVHKVALMGNAGVGKTSIIHYLIQRRFIEGFRPTIGSSVHEWTAHVNNQDVELKIWDTAGQEQYRSLAPISFRDANVAILVFYGGNEQPDDEIREWIESFRSISESETVFIACNKVDMISDRGALMLRLNRIGEEFGCKVFCVSAKTGENIVEMFQEIALTVLQKGSPDITVQNSLRANDDKQCC